MSPIPYTAPTTRASGYLVTAANWNTDLVDNITFLANPPACRVYHNTTQSINDATETTVTFNSERYDTASMHDTATNPERITIGTAGLYIVTFCGMFPGLTTYSAAYCVVRLNGTTNIAIDQRGITAFNVSHTVGVTTVYKFAANDYIEARVYQDNTASSAQNLLSTGNAFPEFSATWIGLG